jgi:hypothetical protein
MSIHSIFPYSLEGTPEVYVIIEEQLPCHSASQSLWRMKVVEFVRERQNTNKTDETI